MSYPGLTAEQRCHLAYISAPRFRGGWSYAQLMHANPRLFKYYWWVFHPGSEAEGAEFLTPKFRLCTHDAFMLRSELTQHDAPFLVFNAVHPRLDPLNPFDPRHPKFSTVEWAPSFDGDMDPIYEGFR